MSAEYDGPTVNGRPILDIETVQRWFKDTCGVSLDEQAAMPIAQTLNHYAFLSTLWAPKFNELRKNDKGRQRMQRISVALFCLQEDLLALIDDAREIAPNAQSEGLAAVVTLSGAVSVLAPGFEKFLPKGRGRKPEPWHGVARKLGPLITGAIKRSGGNHSGFGKATSPAVGIVQLALSYLGINASLEAVADAMRGRKKPGK